MLHGMLLVDICQFVLVLVLPLDLEAGSPADVAEVVLVLGDVVLLVSQLGEGVRHQTRDDVPEQGPEEHRVEDLEQQGVDVGLRVLGLLDEEVLVVDHEEALPDGVAVLLLGVGGVDVDREDGEHDEEGDP